MTKNNESAIRTLMRAEDGRAARNAIAEGNVNVFGRLCSPRIYFSVSSPAVRLIERKCEQARVCEP